MSDEGKGSRPPQADDDGGGSVAGRLTPTQLLVITALAIFVGEALVMFVLALFGDMPTAVEAFLDAILLSILAAPVLYLFLFRPIVLQIEEREAAERALVELNRELERRVEARTDELARSNRSLQREIQERKATEGRILRTNAFVQRLIESAPCLMATIDVTTLRCNYVNGRIEDFLGLPPDEVTAGGALILDRIAASPTRERWREMIRDIALAPEGEIIRDRCEFTTGDGTVLAFRVAFVVASRTAIGEAEEVLLVATPTDDCG